ncbi:MAG: hypothetical protein JO064_06750 [Actinobacteria bacterium]|nr:hypothetical protein [Actinomycetota bacterium]
MLIWQRPRHELALLALVAVAALLPVYIVTAQDTSRVCLTQALVHGRLSNDACLATSVDRARFGNHFYSDKAPGMSVVEVPSVEAVRLPAVQTVRGHSARLWAVRLLASGIAFVLVAWLVGRVAESLAPGLGGASLVAFALGTLVAPLAATNFSEDASAALSFGAFVLAWQRRYGLAGLLAGLAVFVEYQNAAILALVGLYVLVRGAGPAARYAAGVLPGIALLLAYDALAFGSPLHLSYRYKVGPNAQEQATGFFGIGWPRLHSVHEVLYGSGGLLLLSPVLLAAAYGLALLVRDHVREVCVCAAVALFFLVLEFGYFSPYGGVSPGPRFFVPALPFVAVGLAPAFARRPLVTGALSLLSVVPTLGTTLVWTANENLHQTIWGELARVVVDGRSSRLVSKLMTTNAVGLAGLGSGVGLAVMAAAAAAAVVISLRTVVR